jgi:ornithine cyclodeaminase
METVTHELALQVLDYLPLVDWMFERHRHPPAAIDDIYMESEGGTGFLVRPAWSAGDALGVKLATVFPANTNIPSVHAVYVLFDGTDGTPAAVLDATALTWFKTACDSALGSRLLSRKDTRRMLMVGAGSMAPHLIRAHLAVRPSIEQVTIWNRTESRAEILAAAMGEIGARVDVTGDLSTALSEHDLICTATMSPEPLIEGARLSPGAHVDLVGAYTPDLREADDDVMRRGRIFVDSRATTVDAIGDLIQPLQDGIIEEADILGDLYELASATVTGRTSDTDITVFENGGGGHLDLMTAQFMLARAAASQ